MVMKYGVYGTYGGRRRLLGVYNTKQEAVTATGVLGIDLENQGIEGVRMQVVPVRTAPRGRGYVKAGEPVVTDTSRKKVRKKTAAKKSRRTTTTKKKKKGTPQYKKPNYRRPSV